MAEIVYVPTKSATKYTEMEKNLLLGIIKNADGGKLKKIIYDEVCASR